MHAPPAGFFCPKVVGTDKLLGVIVSGFDDLPEGMGRSAHHSDAAAASPVPAVRQHYQAEQESSHTDLQP